MRPFALSALLFASLAASAQTERASEVRVRAPGVGAAATAGAAPAALRSAVAPLAASAAAPRALALSAAAAPAASAAPAAPARLTAMIAAPETAILPGKETAIVPSPAANDNDPSARGTLAAGALLSAKADVGTGRVVFDAEGAPHPTAFVAGRETTVGPELARPTERAAAPAPRIPLKERAAEISELGVYAIGFQLVTGMFALWVGAHAAFPLLAGALWAFAGGELIKVLANLRSVIVGGWQASHDQRYRVDPNTGRLKDIRGHKYGEDRYDERAPGDVTGAERLSIDAAAVALGLPWVLPAGPAAVLMYAAGAAAVFGARRAWRAVRPAAAPVRRPKDFHYDR